MIGNTAEQQLFEAILSISSIDKADIDKAHAIFSEYTEMGVFKECSFESPVWKTTDEYSNIGIHFNFDKFSYKRFYEPFFRITYDNFITYVKVFIAYTMGKNVLKTLQTVVNDLKRIIRTDSEQIYGSSAKLKIAAPSLCIDFLTMLPETDDESKKEDIINALDYYVSVNYSKNTDKKRTLAQFDSYFLFNDILNDYWNGTIDYNERLFFYPIYLWWHITGVIPLRPREFILTKRDCLEKREDGHYLTLRRDDLKGSGKSVHYKIGEDYYDVTYKIPDKLAYEILNYKQFTNEFEDTELETLFISDTHYKRWGQRKHSNSRYLTYINMNTIMRYFFNDIISKRYSMNVVYEKSEGHLLENEINYLHLGDTRHLSLINIMAEGGTPVIAMLLAGHDNIEMSAHYYSNITNLIECRTYRQYRLVTKGDVSYQLSLTRKLPTKDMENVQLSDGGKCYSGKYKSGEIDDCMKCSGPSGEIGYCPSCSFYRKKGRDYFSIDDKYKRHIKDDCKSLTEAIRLVRIGKGSVEDIGETILKLQNSSYSYQEYHKEKIAEIESKGENIWEEKKQ